MNYIHEDLSIFISLLANEVRDMKKDIGGDEKPIVFGYATSQRGSLPAKVMCTPKLRKRICEEVGGGCRYEWSLEGLRRDIDIGGDSVVIVIREDVAVNKSATNVSGDTRAN
jgi:S-adenosylmethionine synthetase